MKVQEITEQIEKNANDLTKKKFSGMFTVKIYFSQGGIRTCKKWFEVEVK